MEWVMWPLAFWDYEQIVMLQEHAATVQAPWPRNAEKENTETVVTKWSLKTKSVYTYLMRAMSNTGCMEDTTGKQF